MSWPTVAAALLTHGEEAHIGPCLRGLTWADELVVLDDGVQNRTPELARAAGATVYHRPFDDYGTQRQALLALTSSDWVLFVDPDERVSAGLAAEVRHVVGCDEPGAPVGYRVPRRNYIWGRWIRGGGWSPDGQLRLFRRNCARYPTGGLVHEVPEIDGPLGTLRCALVHYNYETVGQFVAKQRSYACLAAGTRRAAGEEGKPRRIVTMPLREVYRRYVHLDGRRDGWHGMRLAALLSLAEAETQLRMLVGPRAP